jgi:hypothetical protein
MLAALQGLGEYGALTGSTSGDAATVIGMKVAEVTAWASDHRTAVIVGAVVALIVIWWATNPRV